MPIIPKNSSLYLWNTLLLGVLGLYSYGFLQIQEEFNPYYGDEYFYLKNAQSAVENPGLKASFTYSGKGSSWGQFDAHGPAYPLLYGGLGRFGEITSYTILGINWGILILGILALVFQRLPFSLRLTQVGTILISPFTLFYGFSLMPELIHLAGGIFLYLALQSHFRSSNAKSLTLLLGLILILGMIRSTWFFAYLALGLAGKEFGKLRAIGLILLGLTLSWFSQRYLHEAVPNVFSSLIHDLQLGHWEKIWEELSFNTKRNLYFLGTYSEGYFYWIGKLWLLSVPVLALLFFRKDPVIRIGFLLFMLQLGFAISLYKTYEWTEFRMLSPLVLLIHLRILGIGIIDWKSWYPSLVLGLSLILMLPFQGKVMELRKNYSPLPISKEVISSISALDHPLVRLDTLVLQHYALEMLPVQSKNGKLIRYILPYYSLEEEETNWQLGIQDGQLIVFSKKILPQ